MGDLQHDAHAVPGLSFRILPCTVLQVLYDMKRALHGQVALFSILIHHRADPAVVMSPLISWSFIIQTSSVCRS